MMHAQWPVGHEVSAIVIEVLDQTELLLRIEDAGGSGLIRVANESKNSLKKNDHVRLRVSAIAPLRFQYVEEIAEQKRRGHLDVSV